MSAFKKQKKSDKTAKPVPETTSTTNQNQTISGAENANTTNTTFINLPVVSSIAQSHKTKGGDVTTKTPATKVLNIESKEHFENILTEAGDKYVMVEFYAMWCSPCKLIGLKLEELAELYKDKIVIAKIDVDDLEEMAIEHDITNMPAFMILKNNAKVEQFSGSKVELLDAALEKYLGKAKE